MQVSTLAGKLAYSFPVEFGHKLGMVVTPDGRYIAVSLIKTGQLRVYRIHADHSVEPHSGIDDFGRIYKMCLASNGNLLVCDNCYVHELTGLGEEKLVRVRRIQGIARPRTVAAHGDIVAVGTYLAEIVLLSYESGTIIRTFGGYGSGPGNIGDAAEGLRFTPDGRFILVFERGNRRLSKFHVSNGELQEHYCENQVSGGYGDVEFAPSGEIFVADNRASRICLFSADGKTLLRTWGSSPEPLVSLVCPNTLALVGNRLFVLDRDSAVIKVYE